MRCDSCKRVFGCEEAFTEIKNYYCENYTDKPITPQSDLISRADAIEMAVDVETPQGTYEMAIYVDDLMALPSADAVEVDRTSEWVAVRREEYEDLIADAVQGEECDHCVYKWGMKGGGGE